MTRPVRDGASVPWRLGDLELLYATTTLGFVAVLVGWFGASGQARLGDQMPWASVAASGVVLLGAGNLSWLLAGRRAIGALRRELIDDLVNEPTKPSPAPVAVRAEPGRLVASATMTRYHREHCQLVQGKAVRADTRAVHTRKRRQPCDVCSPND